MVIGSSRPSILRDRYIQSFPPVRLEPVMGLRVATEQETGISVSLLPLMCLVLAPYDARGGRSGLIATPVREHPRQCGACALLATAATCLDFYYMSPLHPSVFRFPVRLLLGGLDGRPCALVIPRGKDNNVCPARTLQPGLCGGAPPTMRCLVALDGHANDGTQCAEVEGLRHQPGEA